MVEIEKHLSKYPLDCSVRVYKALKKSGKIRTICEPSKDLKTWLKQLLTLLEKEIGAFDSRIYSVVGKSCVDFARSYLHSNNLLVIDIKDYFPSIEKQYLIRVVGEKLGDARLAVNVVDKCFHADALPQGFPTSTFLANIVSERVFEGIFDELKAEGMRCGIYVDDIAIGSNGLSDKDKVLQRITKVMAGQGFGINTKTKFFEQDDIMELTGLRLMHEENRVILSRSTWEKVYQGIKSGEINRVQAEGWLSYVSSFDSVRKRRLKLLITDMEAV